MAVFCLLDIVNEWQLTGKPTFNFNLATSGVDPLPNGWAIWSVGCRIRAVYLGSHGMSVEISHIISSCAAIIAIIIAAIAIIR